MKLRGEGNGGFIVLAIIVVLVLAGVINIGIPSQTETATGDGSPTGTETQTSGNVGYATTLLAGGMNALTSAPVDVNTEVYSNDKTFTVAETQTDNQPETLSSAAPNTMAGYLLIGNDNGQSLTDRGSEVYYRKVPFSYVNKGVYQVQDVGGGNLIKLYNETTPTWTGYDDGTAETTLNVTVGSGQTITSTELKIAAGTGGCLGNKDFEYPLAVCFNVSTTADWDEIRPTSYVSTFDACEAHSGSNILGDCYVLPTDAICDYEEYRFHIVVDPATGINPPADDTDYAYAFLLDKTWYKNDNNEWESGWCDDSLLGTDQDPGITAYGNTKPIYFN